MKAHHARPAHSKKSDGTVAHVYHIFLFQSGDGDGDVIDRMVVRAIQDGLMGFVKQPPEHTEIHLWIDSPGGDAHAAYKLALLLRSRCKKLVAIVPDYAKSAATLLALSADALYMDEAAELGPLDAQIPHPNREEVVVSALDVANAASDLAMQAVAIANEGASVLYESTSLPQGEILPSMLRFAAMFFRPLLAHVDPTLVHKAETELAVAEHYAARLLRPRDDRPSLAKGDTATIIQHLVKDFPTHGFVIDRGDARELGLHVLDANEHPRWKIGREIYDRFERDYRPEAKSLIAVVLDNDLESYARHQDRKHAKGNLAGENTRSEDGRGRAHVVITHPEDAPT